MPTGIYPRQSLEERFWPKVDIRTAMECWPWQAAKNSLGYGIFSVGGRLVMAHRAAYELTRGPIPVGLTLDHLCHNIACVNPIHLEPVSDRENILRGNGLAARNIIVRTCPYGHPYSGDNLYINPQGKRSCRTCNRVANKKLYWTKVKRERQRRSIQESQP